MIIAIDFDGTCTTHNFPEVGKNIGAAPVLKAMTDAGHQLILYTMRSHPDDINQNSSESGKKLDVDVLQEAIDWFKKNNIPLFGVNENPEQKSWTSSPKPFAHIYIDDAAYGCPLLRHADVARPFVDWMSIYDNFLAAGHLGHQYNREEIYKQIEKEILELASDNKWRDIKK